MPRFNLSAIMKAAWKHYGYIRSAYADWQIARGRVDASFANALRVAWRMAKEQAKAVAVATGPNASRIADIKSQIEALSYKTLRYDIAPRRRELEAQIAALAA